MSNPGSSDPRSEFPGLPGAAELARLFPQYEVIELLGRGGMGAVYKARQKSLDRLVALKVLPRHIADSDPTFASRFQQEARTLARMSHPGIVPVHDFGEASGDQLYFVMELIDGTDVERRIASEGPLPVAEAVRITEAVCDALAYAHDRGVIHRDIKPANVLIRDDGRVLVADFGLAKAGGAMEAKLTRTDVTMGTQAFAAPELLTPGAKVDQRADLYSLGVMLYEMLTGEIPRVMFKLPSRIRPELGTRFDALICKALETNPEERFQTAAEFRRALTDPIAGPAIETKPHGIAKLLWVAAAVVVAVIGAVFSQMVGRSPARTHASETKTYPANPAISATQSPNPKPVGIKLWDTPARIPKETAVRWENGAVVLGDAQNKGMLNWAQPRSRDAIFRAEIRGNTDAEFPQLRMRYNWTEGPGDFYRLQLSQGIVSLSVSVLGKGRELQAWPLPRPYGADEWVPLELRAVGAELTVSVDGQVLGTIHDQSLSGQGSVMIVASKNGYFRKVEYVPLDSPTAVDPADGVVDLLALVDAKRDAYNGVWTMTPEGEVRSQREGRAGRLEFPYRPPAEYDFEVEFTVEEGNSGYVVQVLSVPGHWLDWRLLPPPAFGPALDGVEVGHGARTEAIGELWRLKPGDRHRSLVEVRTNSLRAVVDGKEIARFTGDLHRLSDHAGVFRLRDTTHLGVGVLDIGLLIHKAIVREIRGAGNVDASGQTNDSLEKNTGVPAIANWQDLTEAVREKARAIPNLIVEPGLVRHTGSGNQVVIPLTPPGVRDYAIRLRFTSDGEISLRSSPDAFIYILCQSNQTIFHHYDVAATAPTLLRPNVPHPADFDSRSTHEMLVTMQGPTLRTWLDGRFLGEAQDTKCKDGDAKLVFTKWTVVHKVEIAELAAKR